MRIADGRDVERNVDQRSVLAAADRLVMVYHLTTPDAGENAGLFIDTLGRHKDCDGLPDDLLRRIPECKLCTFIPAADNAIEVLADDSVPRRLNNGDQPLRGRKWMRGSLCHLLMRRCDALGREAFFLVYVGARRGMQSGVIPS